MNDTTVCLPLTVAAGLSTNISKLLHEDSTARKYNVNINFHNNRNKKRIADILGSSESTFKVELESADDITDFAEFGVAFGNSEFIKPFDTIAENHTKKGLSIKNALDVIKYKDELSHIKGLKIDLTEEIRFIAQNFISFSKEENFIEWCKDPANESRVERIVGSDDIHLNCEDLLNFILQINESCNNRFIHLLQYVHLEFCSISTCRAFLEVINRNDFLQSKHQRNSILSCLSNRILYDNSAVINRHKLEVRYSQEETDHIKSSRVTYFARVTEEPEDFESDIHRASERGKLTSVQYLIEQCKENVEAKDKGGSTPIICASKNGHLEVVKYLNEECYATITYEAISNADNDEIRRYLQPKR